MSLTTTKVSRLTLRTQSCSRTPSWWKAWMKCLNHRGKNTWCTLRSRIRSLPSPLPVIRGKRWFHQTSRTRLWSEKVMAIVKKPPWKTRFTQVWYQQLTTEPPASCREKWAWVPKAPRWLTFLKWQNYQLSNPWTQSKLASNLGN